MLIKDGNREGRPHLGGPFFVAVGYSTPRPQIVKTMTEQRKENTGKDEQPAALKINAAAAASRVRKLGELVTAPGIEPAREQLAGPAIRSGGFGVLYAEDKVGKSIFAFDLALNLAAGVSWSDPDGMAGEFRDAWEIEGGPKRVLYVDAELDRGLQAHRYRDRPELLNPMLSERFGVIDRNELLLDVPEGETRLEYAVRMANAHRAEVVFLDNVNTLLEDASDPKRLAPQLRMLAADAAKEQRAGRSRTYVLVAHVQKGQKKERTREQRPLELYDVQGGSLLIHAAEWACSLEADPRAPKQRVVFRTHSSRHGDADPTRCYLFSRSFLAGAYGVRYEGAETLAEVWPSKNSPEAPYRSGQLDVLDEAVRLCSGVGRLTLAAVLAEYQRKGGIHGRSWVGEALKGRGLLQAPPENLARAHHERAALEGAAHAAVAELVTTAAAATPAPAPALTATANHTSSAPCTTRNEPPTPSTPLPPVPPSFK